MTKFLTTNGKVTASTRPAIRAIRGQDWGTSRGFAGTWRRDLNREESVEGI
ncbi:hypothetical protein [uncultured Roseibium sp.]|uniref:hypothetical protein n=1 Tax=uncultured Roseibium sp. TaxID=1936171 RepID=UPI00321659ED